MHRTCFKNNYSMLQYPTVFVFTWNDLLAFPLHPCSRHFEKVRSPRFWCVSDRNPTYLFRKYPPQGEIRTQPVMTGPRHGTKLDRRRLVAIHGVGYALCRVAGTAFVEQWITPTEKASIANSIFFHEMIFNLIANAASAGCLNRLNGQVLRCCRCCRCIFRCGNHNPRSTSRAFSDTRRTIGCGAGK